MADPSPGPIPSPIQPISDPLLLHWCYHCDKRVAIESSDHPDDVICFDCKSGFVESLPPSPEPPNPDHFLQLLRLIAQAARDDHAPHQRHHHREHLHLDEDGENDHHAPPPSGHAPPTSTHAPYQEDHHQENDDDDDNADHAPPALDPVFDFNAWYQDHDDDEDEDDENENNDIENVEDEEEEEEEEGEDEEEVRRRWRDVIRRRMIVDRGRRRQIEEMREEGELGGGAANRRNRILDWAEILLGLEDSSIELRLQMPQLDTYVGNPGDYVDAAGYEELLQNLAETDSGGRRGAPPAGKGVVEELETVVINSEEEVIVCAVCKDLVSVGESARKLPCGHRYHGDCIVPWLSARNSCPICRFELPTDDPEYEEERNKMGKAVGGSTSTGSAAGGVE